MYVKKNSCKNGRILLTLTHGYRENGKIRQKNIETLGYLDELEKIYDDPIAHFREIGRQRTAEKALETEPIQLVLNPKTKIDPSEVGLKNLGYTIHELRHTYITRAARAGINPRVLQSISGHRTLSVLLNVYTHVSEDDKESAAEKITASGIN